MYTYNGGGDTFNVVLNYYDKKYPKLENVETL
jgi:hypothetical protein